MQLDQEIFDKLKSVLWFSKCGEPPDQSLPFEVEWVDNWPSAIERFTDPEWENTTLEARNALTMHLAKKHSTAYQHWNRLVREAKPKLEEVVFVKVREFQQARGLSQTFFNCVQWDVIAIVMEASYKMCRPPMFFDKLLTVYNHSRFPCGWRGEWPNGRLMVI
jgi:hypothetical protein